MVLKKLHFHQQKFTFLLVTLILTGSTSLLQSCSKPDLTSIEVAKKCQKYHNPYNNWNNTTYTIIMESQSVFSDNKKELITCVIDNTNSIFNYKNEHRNVHLKYSKNECIPLTKTSSCEEYSWTQHFYPYVWGMPCKFFDQGTIIDKSLGGDIFHGIEVFVIHIQYEKETWDYFINKSDFNLVGFKFVFNDDPTKGEIVFNEGQANINGLIVPTKRTWFDLNNTLLGTDILITHE